MTHEEWFKEQFGRLPTDSIGDQRLQQQMKQAETQVAVARRMLQREEVIKAQFEATRYVWSMMQDKLR